MSIEDLWAIVEPFKLSPSVPNEVQTQIDAARHAFIYAWFYYDLTTLGEQHAYGALENGLRIRAKAAGLLPKRKGLASLLETACVHAWLTKAAFDVPGMPKLLDTLVQMRNRVDHGHPHLLPQLSHEMLRICVEILNTLFPGELSSPPLR